MESPGIDSRNVPYQRPQPTGMVADLFTSGALDLDGNEQDWVYQSQDVTFKPLVFNVTEGYYVNLLRVRASGVLSRHRHSGPSLHSRCAANGITWNTTGSQGQVTTSSSPQAKLTPSRSLTT